MYTVAGVLDGFQSILYGPRLEFLNTVIKPWNVIYNRNFSADIRVYFRYSI